MSGTLNLEASRIPAGDTEKMRLPVSGTLNLEASRIPAGDTEKMRLPMSGTLNLEASRIPAGDTEKMQIPVGSPEDGTVVKVFVVADQFLNDGDPIVELS